MRNRLTSFRKSLSPEDERERVCTMRVGPETMHRLLWCVTGEIMKRRGLNQPGQTEGGICNRLGEYVSGLYGALQALEEGRCRTVSFRELENRANWDPGAMSYASRDLVELHTPQEELAMRGAVQEALQSVVATGTIQLRDN